MRVTMAFGRSGLALDLPDGCGATVVRKPSMPVLADPDAAVRSSLDRPIGSRRLEEEARGKRDACILVCDATRPAPNGLLLRPVVERLAAGGIDPAKVTVLVATGCHRPATGAELQAVIGDSWVLGHCAVANHDARSDADHVDLGEVSSQVPVKIDRRFVEAGVRVAIGLVEPHFMAGWSGGRKLIAPGVSHADTIACLHAAPLILHPKADSCVLAGNPVHELQREIAVRVGPAHAINVVIDEGRRLSFVDFGELFQSHELAVAFAEPFFRVRLAARFPVVVASAAGWPLDATYYQTVKAFVAAAPLVEEDGELIVVSECSQGFGSAAFRVAQDHLCAMGPEGFVREANGKRRARQDEWETVMLAKALGAGSTARSPAFAAGLFAPGLSPEEARATGVRTVSDPVVAVDEALERAGGQGRIALIPEGPYVAPYVGGEETV